MQPNSLDPNSAAILEAVSAYAKAHVAADAAIADLGCGEGLLLKQLSACGFFNLTGVGYEVPEIKVATRFDGVDLCAQGWSERLHSRSFDVLIATEVIEHLTNPYLFLTQAGVLLKPAGTFILTFPNVHNFRSVVGYALNGRHSGFFGPNFNDGHPLHDQHIFIPNIHLIRYLLKVAGLSIKSEQYVNGAGRWWAQTAMIVASRMANA